MGVWELLGMPPKESEDKMQQITRNIRILELKYKILIDKCEHRLSFQAYFL